jgi:hypothetical protein
MRKRRQRCNQLRTCRRRRFRQLPRSGRHRLARLGRRLRCWCRQPHWLPRRHPRSRHRRQVGCPPRLRPHLRYPRCPPSHQSLRCRCSRRYPRWLPARLYRRCPRWLPARPYRRSPRWLSARLYRRSPRWLSARLRRRSPRFHCCHRPARLPHRWQSRHRGRRLGGADSTLRTSTTQYQEQQ